MGACNDPKCLVHRLVECMKRISTLHGQIAGALEILHDTEPSSPLYEPIAKAMDNRIDKLNEATAEFVRLRGLGAPGAWVLSQASRGFGKN